MIGKAKTRNERPSEAADVFAATIAKDRILGLAHNLPDDASITVFSHHPLKGLRSRRLKQVMLRGGKSAAMLDARSPAPVVVEEAPPIMKQAYEPGPRAQALLRGIEIAEGDLADAGGSFDFVQVQRLLRGVSRQRIDRRIQDGSLLAVPGPSNRRRFPVVQFDEHGDVVKGLDRVQEALGFGSPWSVLNFLANPHVDLKRRRPIDLLREGALELVVQVARRAGIQGA